MKQRVKFPLWVHSGRVVGFFFFFSFASLCQAGRCQLRLPHRLRLENKLGHPKEPQHLSLAAALVSQAMHLNTTSSLYQLGYLVGEFPLPSANSVLPEAVNLSNSSGLGSRLPNEEDLDVNTDIYSKVMVTVIYLALFLLGTIGNSITAYTLVRKKSLQNLQSTVHYHLASLAFSDLLIFLLCMPIELYNFIWVHHPWAFGNDVCKGYYFLRDACTYATALNIASLSVERYMAICHPFKAKSIMSRSRTKKFISCIWVASFLLAIPMILIMGEIYRIPQNPDTLVCTQIVDDSTLKIAIQDMATSEYHQSPSKVSKT
ncbi:neurotensin receptor type 1-like isoform 2-T2 [Vipera latastei]